MDTYEEPADKRTLERAVAELAAIEHKAGWERVNKVVAVISRHFFSGDPKAVHQDSARRAISLRALAAHPGCPLSKSQLHGLLAAHSVYRSDPEVRGSPFLTPSHVSAVASLDPATRTELLRLAEGRHLSVRELTHRVRETRRRGGEKRGRPPTTGAEKAVTRFENALLFLEEGSELLEGTLNGEVRSRLMLLLERIEQLRALAWQRASQAEPRPLTPTRISGIVPSMLKSRKAS